MVDAITFLPRPVPRDDIAHTVPPIERHNALRRTAAQTANTTTTAIMALKSRNKIVNKKDEAWIHELLKPPSLESLKPQMATEHWRVPDEARHITGMACHSSLPFVAVGSGSREKNLYIYEMANSRGRSKLYHRQTITIPHIHSISWAPLGFFESSTVIATGHRKGLLHIVSLPDSDNPHPARVLRKFNHADTRRSAISRVSCLEFTSPAWTCAPDASIVSLYGESLFMWDVSRNDTPILSQKISSLTNFHASPFRDGIMSLAGAFGIALLDVRSSNPGLLRPKIANSSESTVVKWSPSNSNWVASAHEDSKIRVWDIRGAQPFAELSGHSDIINSVSCCGGVCV
ncbi:WD40-repeat-containing domain protein [Limtongia smithiae]|uniref:WD40-repeat-containing domain protein n=1 Tax=Limtongia smithiae TaxID=1125753 RepID=UPI0034CE15AF